MGRNLFFILIAVIGLDAAVSCEILDNDPDKHAGENDTTIVGLEEVAEIVGPSIAKNIQEKLKE